MFALLLFAAIAPPGDYRDFVLPCGGSVTVYCPGQCECLDQADYAYADVIAGLRDVFTEARRVSGDKTGGVALGKYAVITLDCGCPIRVYIPGSSQYLEKNNVQLAVKLRKLYNVVQSHKEQQ